MSTRTGVRILVVDDEPNIRRLLTGVLADEGYECEAVADLDALGAALEIDGADLLLLDVCLPGADGMQWLSERDRGEGPAVIMMSGHGSIDLALRAVRLGALDFLEKPIAVERLLVSIENALSMQRLRRENQRLRGEHAAALIGESAAMKRLSAAIDRAAPTDATVLITGENGTGKELVARAMHDRSPRAHGPLVRVNCAAIPADLLESELFGHERGAFSGAVHARRGRFELAHRGTLLLDEIGDMPIALQAKLLRALEEGEITRLGAERSRKIDVRLIASTNRDLPARIASGAFREDLYYRLAVLPLHVPPLRDRDDDVALLADAFLSRFCAEHGRAKTSLGPDALARLRAHRWPGNVRELRNLMERLVILGPASSSTAADIDALLRPASGGGSPSNTVPEPQLRPLGEALEDYERALVEQALRAERGNVAAAARRLGLDRANLHRKMRRLGLQRP
jgi:two-component system, NtrC family, nitrogen regulation response regulator NtrX